MMNTELDIVKILEKKVKTLEKSLIETTSKWHQAELKPKVQVAPQIIKVENMVRIKALEQQLKSLTEAKSNYESFLEYFQSKLVKKCTIESVDDILKVNKDFERLSIEYNQLKSKYNGLVNTPVPANEVIVEEKIVYVQVDPKIIVKTVEIEKNTFHDEQCKQEIQRLSDLCTYYKNKV